MLYSELFPAVAFLFLNLIKKNLKIFQKGILKTGKECFSMKTWKRFVLVTMIKLAAVVPTTMVTTLQYSDQIKRGLNYYWHGNLDVDQDCYQHIYGLRFSRPVNNEGKLEFYIKDIDTGERRIIGSDLITGTNEEIIEGLRQRLLGQDNEGKYALTLLYLCSEVLKKELRSLSFSERSRIEDMLSEELGAVEESQDLKTMALKYLGLK